VTRTFPPNPSKEVAIRRIALPLMLLVAAACQPVVTIELTDAEKAAIADEVNAINAEFWDVWREADFDQGMSYYYNSPDLVYATEGVVDYGYAEVDAKYRPGFASVASQTLTITDSRTTVLAPDVVSIVETARFSQTDTDGATGPETDLALTSIWILRDGAWKIQIAHVSLPAPETESM
jgi:ketosteroid isomerase-like protein